ncbi:unnamed protein product [Rhizoctonia solani]|uniref:Uncharacterized protein n=1 Tax=Rhizoctonia solani TaxID=456999 RepID=A0A8H2W675_9AGAM|nr:unnamed protein product [Rhizoctonia solani]
MTNYFDLTDYTKFGYLSNFPDTTPALDWAPGLAPASNFVDGALPLGNDSGRDISPTSNLATRSDISPQTPTDNHAQAGLGVSVQQYSDMGCSSPAIDLFNPRSFPCEDSVIPQEHFKHLTEIVPSNYLVDLVNVNTWADWQILLNKIEGPCGDPWSVVAQENLAHPQLPTIAVSQTSPSLVVPQPLKHQGSLQAIYSALSSSPFTFDQLPAYNVLDNGETYDDTTWANMYPSNSISDTSIGDQVHFTTWESPAKLPFPALGNTEADFDQLPGLDIVPQTGHMAVPLATYGSLSAPVLHNPMSIGYTGYIPAFKGSLNNSIAQLAPASKVLPEPAVATESQAYLTANNPSPTEEDDYPYFPLQKTFIPSNPASSPFVLGRLKRNYEDHMDTSITVSKRIKATRGSHSNSAIPRSSTRRPSPTSTPTAAESSSSSHLASGTSEISVIPVGDYRESLMGIGERYYSLGPGHPTKNNRNRVVPKSNPAIRNYVCRYICPSMNNACWMLSSNQDPDWRTEISKRVDKGFFSRHEAECLRHLAMHRYDEWIKCLRNWSRMDGDGRATQWDDERIDEQIIKDIEQPDTQLWYPSERKNRNPQLMIEWLKASRKSNGYNKKEIN